MLLTHLFKDIPSKKLDALISENESSAIAKKIDLNASSGSILGLTTLEREEACRGYENRMTLQRSYIMEAWKKKKFINASYIYISESYKMCL